MLAMLWGGRKNKVVIFHGEMVGMRSCMKIVEARTMRRYNAL